MAGLLNKFNSNNLSFYKSLKPFYYILKIFGLAPYSFDFNTGVSKSTIINYTILFMILTTHFTAIILSTYQEVAEIKSTKLSIAVSGWNFQHILQTVVAFIVVVHNYIKRPHVFKYIKLLNNVDKIVNDLQWKHKVNHLRKCLAITFWLFLHVVLIIFFFYVFQNASANHHLQVLINTIVYFAVQTYMMIAYEFIFSVCCINSQFDCLNENAKLYLNGFKMDFFWSQNQVNTKVQFIKKLALIHDLLNDAIDCINDIYSIEVN